MEVVVIDNCFLWPMTNIEVLDAFAERIDNIQSRTRDFRVENGDDTTLPLTWPLSVFSNPNEPRCLYIAFDTTKPLDDSFLGFLEVKTVPREYAKVAACVVLSNSNVAHSINVTKSMFDNLVRDCVAMDIPTITIPKNWTDYTENDRFTSARYNFSTDDIRYQRAHRVAICGSLFRNYPYLYFKTPFKSQYIVVSESSSAFLDRFLDLFLKGPSHQTFDVYRTYHVSMWRVVDPNDPTTTHQLSPTEVDIVLNWQRRQIAHQALELINNRPVRIFGKQLVLQSEDPDRLTIVGARRRLDIPPEAVRVENNLWAHGIQLQMLPSFRAEETTYRSSIDGQDETSKTTRIIEEARRNAQLQKLQLDLATQHGNGDENQPHQQSSNRDRSQLLQGRRRGGGRQPRSRRRSVQNPAVEMPISIAQRSTMAVAENDSRQHNSRHSDQGISNGEEENEPDAQQGAVVTENTGQSRTPIQDVHGEVSISNAQRSLNAATRAATESFARMHMPHDFTNWGPSNQEEEDRSADNPTIYQRSNEPEYYLLEDSLRYE